MAVAEIFKRNRKYLGASLAQGQAHFKQILIEVGAFHRGSGSTIVVIGKQECICYLTVKTV